MNGAFGRLKIWFKTHYDRRVLKCYIPLNDAFYLTPSMENALCYQRIKPMNEWSFLLNCPSKLPAWSVGKWLLKQHAPEVKVPNAYRTYVLDLVRTEVGMNQMASQSFNSHVDKAWSERVFKCLSDVLPEDDRMIWCGSTRFLWVSSQVFSVGERLLNTALLSNENDSKWDAWLTLFQMILYQEQQHLDSTNLPNNIFIWGGGCVENFLNVSGYLHTDDDLWKTLAKRAGKVVIEDRFEAFQRFASCHIQAEQWQDFWQDAARGLPNKSALLLQHANQECIFLP